MFKIRLFTFRQLFRLSLPVLVAGGLMTFILDSCQPEPDPEPIRPDPCEQVPGTIIRFDDLVYEFDSLGWPTAIYTDDDTPDGLGSNYRTYRYKGGRMTYTELSLDNGVFWRWDSADCGGINCTHYIAQSDTMCPITGASEPCSLYMTLNSGDWVLTDGETTYHYDDIYRLDSVTSPDYTYRFYYFQGRISKISEFNAAGDSVATQWFTYNSDGVWREFERQDLITGQVTLLKYVYSISGRLTMVSVGKGIPPVTLSDYPVVQEGCGEMPRLFDPLNKYRLPHMRLTYVGLPWPDY